jgi:hypothetical protein
VYRVTLTATQLNAPPRLGTWPINKTLQPTPTTEQNNATPSSDTASPLLSDHRGSLCFMTKKSKYLKNLATDNRVIAHASKSEIFHTSRPLYFRYSSDVSPVRKSFGLELVRLVTTT